MDRPHRDVYKRQVYNLLSVLEGKVLNEGGQIRDEISGEVTIALPAGRENLLFSSPDSIVAVSYTHLDVYKRQVQALYNIVDSVFVSRLSENAFNAVGCLLYTSRCV